MSTNTLLNSSEELLLQCIQCGGWVIAKKEVRAAAQRRVPFMQASRLCGGARWQGREPCATGKCAAGARVVPLELIDYDITQIYLADM